MSMTRTYTQTTYQIGELSEAAKERAIDTMRELNVLDFGQTNAQWVFESFERDELEPYGLMDGDFQFSGFWSQGDGASITGRIALVDWIRKTGNYNKYRMLYRAAMEQVEGVEVRADINRTDHRYSHQYTIHAEISTYYYYNMDYPEGQVAKLDRQTVDCEAELTEWIREKSAQLYKLLEEEYYYQQSDEQIIDMCEANMYEFDRLGNFPPKVFDLDDEDEDAV